MKVEEFQERCNRWEYKSWKKGNLINYWRQANLTVGKIFDNRERLHEKSKTLAILGSVGKTTLSRILYDLIKQNGSSCFLTKVNDNWLPQLPFAVELALRNNSDFSIFECGVTSKGDASLMAEIVPTHVVVYTEFVDVNLSEFGSLDGIAKEKIGFFLKNPNANLISHIKNSDYFEEEELMPVYYGQQGSSAEFTYNLEEMTNDSTFVKIKGKSETVLKINDIGLHLGAAVCGAIAVYSQIKEEMGINSFLELRSYINPKQRMQRVNYDGISFIIDTANANELSILNSLETLITMHTSLPKNAVIGGVYSLGDKQEEIIGNLVDKICKKEMYVFNSVHFVGRDLFKYQDKIRKSIDTKIFFYTDENEFKEKFNFNDYINQIVLLRGPTQRGINLSNVLKDYDGSSEETTPIEIIR